MIDDTLREELSALLDGALPPERAEELLRRIGQDAELRREYEDLRRAVDAVRALPRPRAPAELKGRIRASLASPRGRIVRLGAIAAAATVLLAAGIALYALREPPPRFEAKSDVPAGRAPADAALEKAFGSPEPQAEGARAQARDEAKAGGKDGAGGELAGGSAPKEQKKRGAPAKEAQAEDLLALVVRTRGIPAGEREAYLREVSALGAKEAIEHIRAVFPDEEQLLLGEPKDGSPPVLATIQLEDKAEANVVRRILDALPRAGAESATALVIEREEKDRIDTEVEATPGELGRLARWLDLLDTARATASRPRVAVLGRAKSEDDAPKTRRVVVRLRFPEPPQGK